MNRLLIFYFILKLEKIFSAELEMCPDNRCYSYFTKSDIPRTHCPRCKNIPDCEASNRIKESMKLVFLNQSEGYAEFMDKNQSHILMERRLNYKNPLFYKLQSLKVNEWYNILAWTNEQSTNCIDILNIESINFCKFPECVS